MTTRTEIDAAVPAEWDRSGLPAWTYHSPALLELEKAHIFRSHWLIVCHVSDIPGAGDYATLDAFKERALVVRDAEGEVRGFHNMCRHRGSRVVAAEQGCCKSGLVCPFHGWTYNLDGTLRGVSEPRTFPQIDKSQFGLLPLETEIWNGLVFVRFEKGPQPSVAEIMAPVAEEAGHYRMSEVVPTGGIWKDEAKVNWKAVRDVDNEGYHVASAHPALQDLYGKNYRDDPPVGDVARSEGFFEPDGGNCWSVRHYTRFSSPRPFLPEHLHHAWIYYGLFPNSVIGVLPEGIQFYQEFPVSVSETVLRGGIYRYPDETRQQRLARYLAGRIDRDTAEEDVQLMVWSNDAMASSAFSGFYLSDLEYGVKAYHDHLRDLLPIYTLDKPPSEGDMERVNADMLGE